MNDDRQYIPDEEDDTKEKWALLEDNEAAIGALHEIEHKLKVIKSLTDWTDQPGTLLKMGTLPRNLELVIRAMQKDVLQYTRKAIAKLCGEELPF